MTIAVQGAVGEVGQKAVSELSYSFVGLVACGKFQYGVNADGIYLLNSGNTDGAAAFESSFTLATSDFGAPNNKRFTHIYLEIEIFGNSDITVSVRPNKGSWLSRTVSIGGAGLKTLTVSIQRKNGLGNYHAVKISSYDQFKIHSINGLLTVRHPGA